MGTNNIPRVTFRLLHPSHLENASRAGLLIWSATESATFCGDAAQRRFIESVTPFFQGRYKYEIKRRIDDILRGFDV